MAQVIGVEMVEWIAEAQKCCRLLRVSHGWKWNGEDSVDSDLFWKVNYLSQLWLWHLNLTILMPSYFTHAIQIKLEPTLPLFSPHQLIFLSLPHTLLLTSMLITILPMLFAV